MSVPGYSDFVVSLCGTVRCLGFSLASTTLCHLCHLYIVLSSAHHRCYVGVVLRCVFLSGLIVLLALLVLTSTACSTGLRSASVRVTVSLFSALPLEFHLELRLSLTAESSVPLPPLSAQIS